MSFKFENLSVWRKSVDLSTEVHNVTRNFPREELYSLVSQLKRAADSVSLNIAEGSTGQFDPEFLRFLNIALRSNMEVVCGITLALRRGYIAQIVFDKIYKLCEEILVMINGLKKAIIQRDKSQQTKQLKT